MRILLVEDDEDLGFALQRALEKLHYVVDHVGDGAAADHMLLTQPYDLVVLDIGLPRLSGLDVLRRLRQRRNAVAVLALTARDSVEDRVAGLDAGADDYLVKPFAMTELLARVRALLRRGTGNSSVLSCGRLRVDTAARSASIDNNPLPLTPREFALTEILVRHAGKLVPKADLVQRFSDWDNEIGSNAIEVSIFRLRRKLTPCGVGIRTVRGIGYVMEESGGDIVDPA